MESSKWSYDISFEITCVVVQIAGMSRLLYFMCFGILKSCQIFPFKRQIVDTFGEGSLILDQKVAKMAKS